MQVGAACNLLTDMDRADSNSYQLKQCTKGYYGPACGLCLRNGKDKYGRTGTLKCQECRPAGLIVFAYIASTVLVLLLLCFTIHVTLQENVEKAEAGTHPVRASELLRVRLPTSWQQVAPLPLPFPLGPSCTLNSSRGTFVNSPTPLTDAQNLYAIMYP